MQEQFCTSNFIFHSWLFYFLLAFIFLSGYTCKSVLRVGQQKMSEQEKEKFEREFKLGFEKTKTGLLVPNNDREKSLRSYSFHTLVKANDNELYGPSYRIENYVYKF